MKYDILSKLCEEQRELYKLNKVEMDLRQKIKQDVKSEMGKFQKSLLEEIDRKFYTGIDIYQVLLDVRSAVLYGDDDCFKFTTEKEKVELDRLSRLCIGKLMEYHKDEIIASITEESAEASLFNLVKGWVSDKNLMSLTSPYLQTKVINQLVDMVMTYNPQYVFEYLNSKLDNELEEKSAKLERIKDFLKKAEALVDDDDGF